MNYLVFRIMIFQIIFPFINLLTLEWTSSTIVERSCNWGKNDFSYFGIGSYSDNTFSVIIPGNINPNLNQENVQVGKISVNTIDKGIKSKKIMDCKYWTSYGIGILFCDLITESKIYEGIQLLNDGEINFSGNYNNSILLCNLNQNDNYNDNKEEKESDKEEENNNEKTDENKEIIKEDNKKEEESKYNDINDNNKGDNDENENNNENNNNKNVQKEENNNNIITTQKEDEELKTKTKKRKIKICLVYQKEHQ